MQDKDSEVLQNQRKRRKRIGRIKNTIICIISGWILVSMILIICLFVRTISLEKKIDNLITINSGGSDAAYNLNGNQVMEGNMVSGTETKEAEDGGQSAYAKPPSVGIDDADNLAEAGDIHKVYLTFDDGPSETTGEILDILSGYGLKATFFVTGKEDEESQELYCRIAEEGHTLGMHSYSNKYSVIYQSEEAFAEDYTRLKDYLYEVTGMECNYYRFPGGSSNQISNVSMDHFIRYLNGQGSTYYDWNVSAGDAASAYSAEEIVENVTEDVVKYKTSVVLLHDSADKSATVEALGPLIEELQALGAEILPIDEDTQVIQYVKADSVK